MVTRILNSRLLVGLQKAGFEPHEFQLVEPGEFRKHCLSPRRQRDKYIAPIMGVMLRVDQSAPRRPLHKLHDRVMALLQEFSQFGNGRCRPGRIAGDAQQQLMLERRNAASPCRLFTEAQEFAQSVTKPGEMVDDSLRPSGISV